MIFEFLKPRYFLDDRGHLTLLEFQKDLPFEPKRVFWISGVPIGTTRGFHAHKQGQQALFCLHGRIEVTLKTGTNSQAISLSEEGPGVWVNNMVWGEQKFVTHGATLLVFASMPFEEGDYVRDFSEYLLLSKQGF